MDKKTLEARIRQLLALDKNAADIYADLAEISQDAQLKEKFLNLVQDEKRHAALEMKLLSLLNE